MIVAPGSRFRFGSFEIDGSSNELRKNGLRIRIEDQPFRILWMLVARQSAVVTREELKEALWGQDTHVDFDRSLSRAVNKVRLAIGDSAANPRFIETLSRRGYRFVAPVARIQDAVESSLPPALNDQPIESPATPSQESAKSRPLWQPMAALVLVAGLAGIPFLILPRFWSTRISSLAVMPFESLSSVPAQNYLGDAMTEQLIATFSRIRSLRVVSQKSVMRYKGGHRKLSDIAADLNVDAILVGSATDAGERVQINVRLIRFPGERALWSKSFDRSSGDVLMLQAELVLNVAAEIGRLFTPAEEKRLTGSAHAVDPELHALYLQGRLFASEPGRESIERGIRTLETVLAKEPGHAAAWVALAEGWFSLSSVYLNPRQAMPYAKAAARKAIALDPESDAGHAMLGRIHVTYDWDWQAGEDQLQKAIELNPNSSSAWRGLAFLRMAQGRSDESLQTIRRALALDPMSIWTHFQCAVILACMRRNDEAIRQARRALEWEPEFGFMRGMLGLIHGQKGEFAEAIRQLERSVQSIKVPTTLANLVLGYAQAGRQADAERIMSELLATADRQYVCPFEVAAAFAAMGRKEEAFQWMNKSITDRADCMIWLREEPWLDLIRSDSRYSELVRQVGLP